jgi:hypothetical protein
MSMAIRPDDPDEAQLKVILWEKMRRDHGDEWMEKHARFLEAQWEWAKQLGMLDPEVDIPAFSQPSSPSPPAPSPPA